MAATALWLNRTFSSLKLRNYRLLWLGSASEHTGEWMERIAVGWLVLQITDSPFMLGLNEALRFIALLIFPFVSGAVADRVDRKKLLIATLLGLAALSLMLLALVWTDRVAVWHILTYSFLSGVLTAFNHPARATILASIVDKANYTNAVSLDSVSVMSSRIIGSPIAGLWIAAYGVTGIMGMRFVGCTLAVMWLLWLRAPRTLAQARRESMVADVREGMRYVAKDQAILGVTLMSFVPAFFIAGYVSQLPEFARDVLGIGAGGLGWLHFVAGVGSLIGLVGLASLGEYRHKGVLFFLSMIVCGLALVLFSASRWIPLALLMLVVEGATISMFTALRSTLVLLIVPDNLRGRVIALRELSIGMQPFGTLMLGALAQAWGAPLGLGIMAGLGVLIGLGALATMKRVRELE